MKNRFETKLNHVDIIINIESNKKLSKKVMENIYENIFDDNNILWQDDYTPYEYMNDINIRDTNNIISDIKCISTWGMVNGRENRIKMEFNVKYE